MKKITMYQSWDGFNFETADECNAYEGLTEQLEKLERKTIGCPVDDPKLNFANGGGFVMHKLEELKAFERGIMEIADTDCKHFQNLGRYLDGNSPRERIISKYWNRGICFDKYGREWGQPYFAINPEKGTQKEWKR